MTAPFTELYTVNKSYDIFYNGTSFGQTASKN